MHIEEFLRNVTATPGLTGSEMAVAEYIASAFRPYADEVKIDRLNNVVAHIKGDGPKVMFCAHLDEIGLMVVKIEDDGSLRMGNVGGVDPRILPGMRLTVYGREPLLGIVGAKAPTCKRRKKARRTTSARTCTSTWACLWSACASWCRWATW